MTAEDARKLSEDLNDADTKKVLEKIYDAIKKEALKGGFSTTVGDIPTKVIKKLRADGFVINYYNGTSYDGGAYHTISWEKKTSSGSLDNIGA